MSVLFDRQGTRLEALEQGLAVTGDVDFDVAAPLASAGREWLAEQASGTCVRFDLCGVDRVSSAALSVLLDWTRGARGAGLEVKRVALSAPLARLTVVAGLNDLLPLDAAT